MPEENKVEEKKLNLLQKIQMCRVELQNKNLKKSGENKFANFKYYELSDFLPTVNELFNKYKLFSQFTLSETTATLEIYDTEKTYTRGEFEYYDSVAFTIPSEKVEIKGSNAIQNLGGSNTYLRRYLYLNALEIVENDMYDATSGKANTKTTTKKNMPNKDKLMAFCKENNINLNDIAKQYKLTSKSSDDDFYDVLCELMPPEEKNAVNS